MFKSLAEYLQSQRDREEAQKRKLNLLKRTVRNGEAGEIIAGLIDLGSVGVDFKKTTTDYIYEYFASARSIDVLVVMLFLNMKHCSGQQKLATALEFFQNNRSDSFGVKPPLY